MTEATEEQVREDRKRKYDEIDVEVPHPVEQMVVVDASQRMSKWPRMKAVMLKSLGIEFEEVVPEPTVVKGEAVYVIAKAPHPFTGDTVCLTEKSRGQGYVIMPESALKPIIGRALVVGVGQQYSNWGSMEDKMGIKVTPEFKAKIGQVGLVVGKEAHPRDDEIQVIALQIPEGGVVLVKSKAIRELPVSIVEITDPLSRYHPWPKMAEALGIEEPKEPPQLTAGQAGIALAEKKHFLEPDTIVVAVELLNGAGTVMLDKRGLKYVKY
eukprot:TRINITY_DN35020_c0_g1_i1.p1 TRINITY_DN35020_c0_g1~~TRINITY_DN35020_c0_g1_i1.p1  ORF type:complete len:278 (+),score=76.70 TRINITY_DN35020_c0_g1_i1:32-835(+)